MVFNIIILRLNFHSLYLLLFSQFGDLRVQNAPAAGN